VVAQPLRLGYNLGKYRYFDASFKKENCMKRFLSILLSIMLMVTFLPEAAFAESTVPEGKAISTASDFLAIADNPKGTYYLTNDIFLPEGASITKTFKGTLDGRGYTIQGFAEDEFAMEMGLFRYLSSATVKNLTLSDVNITVESLGACLAGGLASKAKNSTIENVHVSGSIAVNDFSWPPAYNYNDEKARMNYLYVGGLMGKAEKNTISKCSSDVEISFKGDSSIRVSGIASLAGICGAASDCTIKSCSNTGSITAETEGYKQLSLAGITGHEEGNNKLSKCTNSGNITARVKGSEEILHIARADDFVSIGGIAGDIALGTITSCQNQGDIAVYAWSELDEGSNLEVEVGGITGWCETVRKSSNSGNISVQAEGNVKADTDLFVGGIAGHYGYISESYNTGEVYVTSNLKKDCRTYVGGIAGTGDSVFCSDDYYIKNCYNTGDVEFSGGKDMGWIGGICGGKSYGYIRYNYNSGNIQDNTNEAGAIVGIYSDSGKRKMYYNYYLSGTAEKAYGEDCGTPKAARAKATRVSSLTSKKCAKLSSEKWVYSKDLKRMILKNNKEK